MYSLPIYLFKKATASHMMEGGITSNCTNRCVLGFVIVWDKVQWKYPLFLTVHSPILSVTMYYPNKSSVRQLSNTTVNSTYPQNKSSRSHLCTHWICRHFPMTMIGLFHNQLKIHYSKRSQSNLEIVCLHNYTVFRLPPFYQELDSNKVTKSSNS